ncbi:MAG: hypothetical protein WAS07_07965 [Micropruina sp.]
MLTSDRLRQVVVTLSEIFCVVGTLYGIGVIGTRVEEVSGGALAADATLLAPAVRAFSIWSVIYLGLFAYTIWQWLPSSTTDPRARRTGWLAAASMVLNAVWLLVTQVGWIWVSVLVIVALLAVLARIMYLLNQSQASGPLESIALDSTFGLYLGWVAVATCANVTAAFVNSGVNLGGLNEWLAAVVLLVAGGVGVFLAATLGARMTIAAAMAWGIGWIAVGRLAVGPISVITGVTAIIAALAIVASVFYVRRVTA